MPESPNISDAEWDIMRIVWQTSPLTAADIISRLSGSKTWKPKTVKTLIGRLVQKQALGFNKDGREYTYFPLLNENECVQEASRSFLDRIYGGSLKPMMVHFLANEKLSSEDIKELKALLQEKEQ
ncbi:BlaI/MecI/CopY family transcriptional regulator [Cohnella mopanensis]|uniref:BlaI/MecI/CopY family transcriptional regulator n=1 Tax=Cohnella mopanensis TaxID=2911966 RepID=UPI001EF7B604|nr:BlaI/MecI/CopY family transcriptional regulator [Cohnella mopanensis]